MMLGGCGGGGQKRQRKGRERPDKADFREGRQHTPQAPNAARPFLLADLKWVNDALRRSPGKMKSVKALLWLDDRVTFDANTELSPDLIRRNIARLPLWFLKIVLLSIDLFTSARLSAIIKTEPRAAIQLLQRLCLIPATFSIWTNQRASSRSALSSSSLPCRIWSWMSTSASS